MEELLRCRACGDVVGTYEPVVAVVHDAARVTSLAREPRIGEDATALVHRSCALEGPAVAAGVSASAAAALAS